MRSVWRMQGKKRKLADPLHLPLCSRLSLLDVDEEAIGHMLLLSFRCEREESRGEPGQSERGGSAISWQRLLSRFVALGGK